MEILPQLLVNALIAGSTYALASSGLALSYGILRILNFAHGHLMMLGAYLFYLLYVTGGQGLFISGAGAGVMMSLVGALTLMIFVLPFSKFSTLMPFVTTLALSTILESLVAIFFGVNVKSLTIGAEIDSIEFWGIYITPIQIVIITSAIILLSLLAFIIHGTSVGRRIRALSELEFAAETLGISSKRVQYGIFIVGVLFASYAGILVGFETNLQPTMGNSYTIKAFAAMTLGGLGNLWGTVIGSYILGLIENLSLGIDIGGYSIPAGYKDAFSFIVILGVLLFRPQGLFNRRARRT